MTTRTRDGKRGTSVDGAPASSWDQRVGALDWMGIEASLADYGAAATGPLLTPAECVEVRGLYDAEDGFRSRIVMARHGFGRGEYKYFSNPLPGLVHGLRTALYPRLAPIANGWAETLRQETRFPASPRCS